MSISPDSEHVTGTWPPMVHKRQRRLSKYNELADDLEPGFAQTYQRNQASHSAQSLQSQQHLHPQQHNAPSVSSEQAQTPKQPEPAHISLASEHQRTPRSSRQPERSPGISQPPTSRPSTSRPITSGSDRPNNPIPPYAKYEHEYLPILPPGAARPLKSRWKDFVQDTTVPAPTGYPRRETVTRETLQQQANLDTPIRPLRQSEKNKPKEKVSLYESIGNTVTNSPIILGILRTLIWCFSAVGLGLAGSILAFYEAAQGYQASASCIIAIVVSSTALIYTPWILWDEYMGKPIGLREPISKLKRIYVDILFIVFQAANVALQIEAVRNVDDCETGDPECETAEFIAVREKQPLQKALAGAIVIALFSWLVTFVISVARVVARTFPPNLRQA